MQYRKCRIAATKVFESKIHHKNGLKLHKMLFTTLLLSFINEENNRRIPTGNQCGIKEIVVPSQNLLSK